MAKSSQNLLELAKNLTTGNSKKLPKLAKNQSKVAKKIKKLPKIAKN